ncbi:MAG: 5-(carboxyamino)imidazole ribonucleotide mutase [Planctomycetota bacterium]|jgi:5-(carboxyamino)imidazole ribonucleotide mutase
MSEPQIGFVLGSTSDLEQIEGARATLKELGVAHEVRIISAHRTPAEAHEYATTAHERGLKAIIGMAGMAAHLAGVLAAVAKVPVLGVPARGGALNGVDALYSTVQMPAGIPVATFAIGKAGATNAAIFACQMMALSDPAMREKLDALREAQADKVRAADKETR